MLNLLHELKPLLHLDALTVTGNTLGQELAKCTPLKVPRELSCIQPFSEPLHPANSLIVLRGNLAPGGAVLKASASKYKHLLKHTGRAVVFKNSQDLTNRIDDLELDVTKDDVLVLQNIGPVGNPGMPESGMIPIPRKLGSEGVMDMLRVSDGRMSGTAGGTIVLHVSPEAADPGSILGIVQSGDTITCDIEKRLLQLNVSDEEIASRQKVAAEGIEKSDAPWKTRDAMRGYRGLYMRSVNQAEHGADFDFLTATGPAPKSQSS